MSKGCHNCTHDCASAAKGGGGGGKGGVDADKQKRLESLYEKLYKSNATSLLKKHLNRGMFDRLKTKKTSFGSTLLDCIQSGLENLDSGVGVYAPDGDSYSTFGELFDAVIEDYHMGFSRQDRHPPSDWGRCLCLHNPDPKGEFIVSTRIRCGRSVQGIPFNPCMTEAHYLDIENRMKDVFLNLSGEYKGKYYPLTGMSKEDQQQLIDDHFLFKEGDRFLQSANACRFWPTGRGIYHNNDKTFLVWVNEEDHLRIISMQQGGDIEAVYKRLIGGVSSIEKKVKFARSDRFGYLTFCPTNLGTTIRASVHIKVPKLAKNYAELEKVAGKYELQVRGTAGEHSESKDGVYDISNKRRLGLTEYDAVKVMHSGISELIKIEKSL